jgi:hypothetical protein
LFAQCPCRVVRVTRERVWGQRIVRHECTVLRWRMMGGARYRKTRCRARLSARPYTIGESRSACADAISRRYPRKACTLL